MTPVHARLLLVPNTLDLGTADPPPVGDVLPIGALRAAAGLGHWVVENAKSARAFLKRVDAVVPLSRPIQELHVVELPRPRKGTSAIAADDLRPLLAPALQGHDLGLLSEAGLPAVADPGAALVLEAHAAGIPVVPLSGPSSLMLAVAASGLNGQSFAFAGYLPTDAAQRVARLRELEAVSRRNRQTQIAIETPYRNAALWSAMLSALAPGTWVSVSCGLTLAGGFTRTGTVQRMRQGVLALPDDVPAVFCFLAA